MQNPPHVFLFPSLLLVAVTMFLAPGTLHAQTVPSQCLSAPDLSCVDALNSRLIEIEAATTDPQTQAEFQSERAVILAGAGRVAEAETVVGMIHDPWVKDAAIVSVIRSLDNKTQTHGRRLLAMVKSPDAYEVARGSYLAGLAELGDFDQVLAEVAATDRNGRKLQIFGGMPGLLHLIVAAVAAGRAEDAMTLIETHAIDADTKDFLKSFLVAELIGTSNLEQAESVLASIADQYDYDRVNDYSHLAFAVMAEGDVAKAETLFAKATEVMSSLENPDKRWDAFIALTEWAMRARRFDLAKVAAHAGGTSPLDIANRLSFIVKIGAEQLDEKQWRPLTEEVIEILKESPRGDPSFSQFQDEALAQLAIAVTYAGDPDLAETLIGQLSDKDRQSAMLTGLAHALIDMGQLKKALTILPSQPDWDIQVQGLIRLAEVARQADETQISDRADGIVLGLVEGPESVTLSDRTISELARYEASIGDYNIANIRLNFVKDRDLQTLGRIINVGSVAQFGTAKELDEYVSVALEAIAQYTDLEQQISWTANLMNKLVASGKDDLAFAIADAFADPDGRDELFVSLVKALKATYFAPALEAALRISPGPTRDLYEHIVLRNALTVALAD